MSIQSRKKNRKHVSFMHQRIEQEEVIEYRVDYCKASYEHENIQKIDNIEPKPCLIKRVSSERVSFIHQRIEQEEVMEYRVNYYDVDYYEYEYSKEVDYIESRPCLIEIIEDQNVECCEIIEDQKVEYYEVIEDQKAGYCESIEDQNVKIIEDQKIEDINMLKSSENESYKINKLNLSKKELRVILRERGGKNYENLSKSRLIKEIEKLKPSKGLKKNLKKDNVRKKEKRSVKFKPIPKIEKNGKIRKIKKDV